MGCASTQPSPPQARVATPQTVTATNPAGDAEEPEDAALTRLLSESFSERRDRTGTLAVTLADASRWRRVKIFGHPTRVTHRYGDDHYAVDAVDYRAAEGDDSAEACLQRFADRARDAAQRVAVDLGPVDHGQGQVPRRGARKEFDAMPYVRGSGEFTTLFRRQRYVGAVVAYPSWPGTCLVHAFAVRVGTDEPLALRVVDRWLSDLAPRTRWLYRVRSAPPFDDR